MTDAPVHRRLARPAIALAALAAVALSVAGCGAEWSTLNPVSDFGHAVLDVYGDVLWWTIGIFVVVEALLFYALWRFRAREGDGDVPEQVHGHTALEIGWTLAPAAILFFIAIPTVKTIFTTQGEPPQRDPVEVTVTGHQWWWEFEYPDLGVVTANELHVPRGRTVRLTMSSDDVIHSFWAPRLGGKRDLNPGSETTLWFTPDSTGVYEGQCAELCGTSHANMRFRVFVEEPDAFEAWVDARARPAAIETTASAAVDTTEATAADTLAPAESTAPAAAESAGFRAFLTSGCAACHAIDGTAAQGRLGPDLTHVGSRTTLAAGLIPNTPDAMAGWLRTPDSVKPGVLMPDLALSEAKIDTLVTFLEGLK